MQDGVTWDRVGTAFPSVRDFSLKTWDQRQLLGAAGRHLYSGPQARIQILCPQAEPGAHWALGTKQLLLVCLSGSVIVETIEASAHLSPFDQCMLGPHESFRVTRTGPAEAVVQFVWMPGVSEIS